MIDRYIITGKLADGTTIYYADDTWYYHIENVEFYDKDIAHRVFLTLLKQNEERKEEFEDIISFQIEKIYSAVCKDFVYKKKKGSN